MSQAESQGRNDPIDILRSLGGRMSATQVRRFCVACCRRLWEAMPEAGRRAVVLAERNAAGEANDDELADANDAIGNLVEQETTELSQEALAAGQAAFHASYWCAEAEEAEDCARCAESAGLDPAEVLQILREVIGDAFQNESPA